MKVTLQKIIGYLVAIILTIVIMKSCKNEAEPLYSKPRIVIKKEIVELTKSVDSTKAIVKGIDSVRVKTIVKWRIKTDTVHEACDTLVLICNEIIKIDSSEIASLKHITLLQDSIIDNQKELLKQDSTAIKHLTKANKKLKWQKRGIIAAWALREGAAILK